MKFQRPGYTESTLMLIHYIMKKGIKNNNLFESENQFINWLFTTSGFYDKKINGSYFDFKYDKVLESENYNNFLQKYTDCLRFSDNLCLLFHNIGYEDEQLKFTESLEPKGFWDWFNYKPWYQILQNKKVLLVNSFSLIMEKQYTSGNLHKIDPSFPILSNITTIKTPYTFFNQGPDQNFFETLENIKKQIINTDFDVAIIACGAYAVFLANYCHELGKTGISIGSAMHGMFGIDTKQKENPFYISEIPNEYKPNGYEKIENGRYWI